MTEAQGADGVAHITYYDKPSQLSFVWDGRHGAEVAVSWGGYAEPVVDSFELPSLTAGDVGINLRWFESQCQMFIFDWRRRLIEAVQQGFGDGRDGRILPPPIATFQSAIHSVAWRDAYKQGTIYANGGMVDTRELASFAGLTKVDTAIPQQWADDVERVTGKYPTADGRIFVWSYDFAGIWGQPIPLTVEARELLASYDALVKA